VSNLRLIFLGVQSTSLDDVEADVDNVTVGHCVVSASLKHHVGEKAEDECMEAVGGMPISGHTLPVCFAILGCCFTVVVDKPHEHIDEAGRRHAPATRGHQGRHR
jgi:hypothetical protein